MEITITNMIIAFTCLVSLACFSNDYLFDKLAHNPSIESRHISERFRWITSGFVHVDFWHLFVNMFVFSNFGDVVEYKFIELKGEMAGKILYVCFYIFMIILANLPTYAKHQNNSNYRAVGASGAVAAITFSFIVFYPTQMLSLYLIFPIPAVIFGILYLWYEHWAGQRGQSNIGHDAHFFGAVAGFLFTVLLDPSLIGKFIHQIVNIF
jgi:membrane associated rhomboid family serine protease